MLIGRGGGSARCRGQRSRVRQAAGQLGGFGLHAGGQIADVGQQGRICDQPDVQGAGQGDHRDAQGVALADLGQ